jgi:GLPGLI family protein
MIKYIFPAIALAALVQHHTAFAQNNKPLKQGRVVYEQLIKGGESAVSINGVRQTFNRPDRIVKWELLFNTEQSLRRSLETDERPEVEMAVPASGAMAGNVRVMSSSMADATIWHNFTEGRKVDQREAVGKKYLVEDSITKHTWKLTGESKTILGYTCQKAITQTPVKSFSMQMQDGEFKRTEKWDTINVTVWFAPAIAIPAGPEYQGELPGLILEYDSRNGSTVTRATEISETVKAGDIKEPKGGKKISKADFDKEVETQQKEMMDRMRSSRRVSF